MKRRTVALIGVILLLIAVGSVFTLGHTYTAKANLTGEAGERSDYSVVIENGHLTLVDQEVKDGNLYLTFRAIDPGKDSVDLLDTGLPVDFMAFRVLPGNVIMRDTVLGDTSGGPIALAAVAVFLAVLLFSVSKSWYTSVKENQYRYRNILLFGLSIYLLFLLVLFVWDAFRNPTFENAVNAILSSANTFAIVALPIAFVVFLLVTLSNIDLLRKEGRTWRNLLGFFLGLLILVSTVVPNLVDVWLQRTTLVDVHNEAGAALYVSRFLSAAVFFVLVYLESILLGAIYHGYRAARHVPEFDKDYILILGCKIRSDGTPTPLLRGRIDRAIEFARMQKEATGKDIVFVPSGGKGSDEVISEAECMHNYLVEQGIPEEQILVENQSANTYENFGCSMKLIREHSTVPDPKIAFSTTNYHVFRSGYYATKQGISADGIGSRTKVYYWVNAYIREFIATLRSEWKTHLRVILTMLAAAAVTVAALYASVNY